MTKWGGPPPTGLGLGASALTSAIPKHWGPEKLYWLLNIEKKV